MRRLGFLNDLQSTLLVVDPNDLQGVANASLSKAAASFATGTDQRLELATSSGDSPNDSWVLLANQSKA